MLLLLGLDEERFDGIVDDGHVDDGSCRCRWNGNVVLVVEGEEHVDVVAVKRLLEVIAWVCAFDADLTDDIDVVIAVVRAWKTHDGVAGGSLI